MKEYDADKVEKMLEKIKNFDDMLIQEFTPTWTEIISLHELAINLLKQSMIVNLIDMNDKRDNFTPGSKWDPEKYK